MAITVYGLRSGATLATGGPWNAGTTQVQDISTLTTGAGPYNILGFMDGEQRCKIFYSSNGAGQAGATALPQLAVPNALPNSAQALAANAFVYVVNYSGYIPPWGSGTGNANGLLYFSVTYAAGNPDGGSPAQFSMDLYGLLLVDSITQEFI